ncbi:MAG TPA: LacI family transcriptional regulator [Clostridiales bacterium]|nr:LacI family transcriptional regulator [Clostridiales bacterium]
MGVTSKEIAQFCGVSRGTVDRALHDKPGIRAETRTAILQAAAELGYVPDLIGRSLVRGRTMTLGVVVFNLKNPYFSQMLDAITERARQAGYAVMIMLSGQSAENEFQAVRSLQERRVDGLIVHPVGCGTDYEAFLHKSRLPVVVVGNRLSASFDFVSIANAPAAADATRWIIGRGYRRILFVAPPLGKPGQVNLAAQLERQSGFLQVVQAQAVPHRVIIQADYLPELQVQLAESSLPTAVLCSSDVFALEILDVWRSGNRAGLMGFDHTGWLKYIHPRLTTVDNPVGEIGRQAVERLLERIQKPDLPGQELVVPHQIIPGETMPPVASLLIPGPSSSC